MYPGAHLIGAEEEASVLEVIRSKRLFRYYGIGDGDSKVAALEQAFADRMGLGTLPQSPRARRRFSALSSALALAQATR
jgi:hypothetical protein